LINNKRHREDGPAVVWYNEDGSIDEERYYLDDKLHREGGAAAITYFENGNVSEEIYCINNENHREDGPAHIFYYMIVGEKRTEYWHLENLRHREDDAAVIWYDRNGKITKKFYYINGNQLSKEDFEKRLMKKKLEII